MARAKSVSWFNLVAGLVLGATTQPLVFGAVAYAGEELVVAQAPGRAAQAHATLSKAIECHRQGDYETADICFKDVLPRLADLTPTEQEEFKRFSQDNLGALAARQNASRYLGYATKALAEGRTGDAAEQVKKASLNEQYMTDDDKERLADLGTRLKVVRSAPPAAPTGPEIQSADTDAMPPAPVPDARPVANPALARAKVKQARAQLGQSDFEACEMLLAEADALKAAYANGEDTPAKVREDLTRAKTDGKALLAAARHALGRKDYDHAEQYARLAEKSSSLWTLSLVGDTPTKVMKDVQAARAEAKMPAKTEAPKVAQAEKPGMLDSMKGMFGGGKSEPTAPAKPVTAAEKTVTANASPLDGKPEGQDGKETARKLVKEGRDALKKGDLAKARNCADQAHALKVVLGNREDTPERLLADVAHAEDAAKAPKADAKAVADAKPAKKGQSPRDQGLELLKKGRAELAENKIDEATKSALLAKALNVEWGLFEDTPESLIGAIEKKRVHRNQDESGKVLVEGRRLLDQKDYDGAMRAAYRAQTLHGSYYIWDLGDRPENLIADVEAARSRPRKLDARPDAAVAKKDNATPPPAPPPAPDSKPTPATVVTQGPRIGEDPRPAVIADATPVQPPAGPSARPPFHPVGGGSTTPIASAEKPADPVVKPALAVDTNKAHAQRLLDEARQLARDGDHLIEARRKCLDAEKFHVAYATDEEGPGELLQQLSRLASQRVRSLVSEANDRATDAKVPEAQRYQEAEKELAQARDLATQYGLDTQTIDGRLKWVKQLSTLAQAETPRTPTGIVPVGLKNETPVEAAPDEGHALLTRARNLLRGGMTVKAREAAEEACRDQYGVRTEAEAVLRSIDNEEFAQSVLTERKKFAVVQSAFNRKDFANARAMLDTVNPKALTDVQAARLKEMLQTPEMQPAPRETAVVRVQDSTPSSPMNDSPNTILPPPPGGPGAGTAHVTDTNPQESLLKATEAMRVVQFDKLRKMGLKAQQEAAEKFRTGQTDAALDTLKEYLDVLGNEHLDSNQLAMLKRPVESRLDQFRLLKEQNDFQNQSQVVAKTTMDARGKHELAERAKQQRVSELLKQFNNFYHDGKYTEAESYARLALELDPDNGTAAASVSLAQMHLKIDDAERTKKDRDSMVLETFRDGERQGPFADIRKPLVYDKDQWKNAKTRGIPSLMQHKSPIERELDAKLSVPVGMHFSNTPLSQAVDDLKVMHNINFYIDERALENQGVSKDHPVSINLEQISLKSALKLLLRNVNLTYVIKDETVQITTAEHARGNMVRNTIQVADLVIPIENYAATGTAFPGATPAGGTQANTAAATAPSAGSPYTLNGGSGVGSPTSGSSSASPFASLANNETGPTGNWAKKQTTQTREDALINLIISSIEPNSWPEKGGPGTIQYFAPTMSLVINQTVDIQEQIQDLLASLRALQDQEVAIEIRFITIADDFYERIGVDFNMNIQTDKNTAKFEPALLANQFKPQGLINNPSFKGLVSGLTPAGTLTSDLDVPIRANSFNAAFPSFGGYSPGVGGLNVGLAFLSDIQVFLFMEAVAGDVRTNVMTAPKITLQNGETATLTVSEGTRNFLTSISYQQVGTQFVAQPVFTPIAQNGVFVTIQAVISADRRFVRLAPTLTLSNTSNVGVTSPGGSGVTPVIPVQLPLYPTLVDPTFGPNGASPVLFTQFIQAPSINTIGVSTTVTVPDGGTVLMGGLKIMSEGRNEYGAPILSKIPYINRLFRNTSYGRDSRSLMIMVTPRIIIQAEEEDRQTGYSAPRIQP